MRSSRLAAVAAMAALVGVLVVPATRGAADPPAENVVVEWNETAWAALTASTPALLVHVLHQAMVHGAVYDAVNAIDGGYEPYLGSPSAMPWYSKEAAAATAAYEVLLNVAPTQAAMLDAAYATSLSAIPDGAAKDGGIAVGEAAAQAMIDARTGDGRFGAPGWPVGNEPGEWRPTLPAFVNDPTAWVANVRPFLIDSPSQFRSDGPDPLSSRAYAEEFNEVKTLGSVNSSTRTQNQTDAALFWGQGNPPAMWSIIFRSLATSEGLSTAENARLFAMLYLSAADGAVACWDSKGHWLFWRPITAIRDAEFDGNPATTDDDGWLPLLPTPPYPDNPSAHACISGSFVSALRDFFGTDKMSFGTTNPVNGIERDFTRFSQAIKEIIDARIWGGLHFRVADVQGAVIAKKVGRWRERHYFQPV